MTMSIDPGATLEQQLAQAAALMEEAKRTRKWVDFTVGDRFCRIGYTERSGRGPFWPIHCDPNSVDSWIRSIHPWFEEDDPERKYLDYPQRSLLEHVGILPWPIKLLSIEVGPIEKITTQ